MERIRNTAPTPLQTMARTRSFMTDMLYQAAKAKFMSAASVVDPEAEAEHLRESLADDRVWCLVAESDGTLVGQITVLPAALAPHPVDEVGREDVVVVVLGVEPATPAGQRAQLDGVALDL